MENLNVQQLYYKFEREVYNVITSNLDKDKGEKISDSKVVQGFECDFYLPQGCDKLGIPSKTIIEIKLQIVFDIVPRLHRVIDAINNNHKEEPFHLWLIVKEEDRLDLINSQDNVIFRVMTGQQFTDLSKSKIDKKEPVPTSEPSPKTKQQVPLPPQDEIISRAHNDAQTKKITLFLGAGVSVAAGLPAWKCLLCKVRDSITANPNMKVDATCLEDIENSNIILAKWYQLVCNSIDNNAQERKKERKKGRWN